jgi:hypothetical protein
MDEEPKTRRQESDTSSSSPQPPERPEERIESGGVALTPTSLRLDDEMRRFLREEAERRGVGVSEVARQALAFYQGWLAADRAGKLIEPESTDPAA